MFTYKMRSSIFWAGKERGTEINDLIYARVGSGALRGAL